MEVPRHGTANTTAVDHTRCACGRLAPAEPILKFWRPRQCARCECLLLRRHPAATRRPECAQLQSLQFSLDTHVGSPARTYSAKPRHHMRLQDQECWILRLYGKAWPGAGIQITRNRPAGKASAITCRTNTYSIANFAALFVLERNPCAQLNLPARCCGFCNRAKLRCIPETIRRAKIRMVKRIKELPAELKLRFLSQVEIADHGHIKCLQAGDIHRFPANLPTTESADVR